MLYTEIMPNKLRSALALATGILAFAGAVVSMIRAVDRRLEEIDTRLQKLVFTQEYELRQNRSAPSNETTEGGMNEGS